MLVKHTVYLELSDGTEIEADVTASCGYEDYGADADGNRGIRQFYVEIEDTNIVTELSKDMLLEAEKKLSIKLDNLDWHNLMMEEKEYV